MLGFQWTFHPGTATRAPLVVALGNGGNWVASDRENAREKGRMAKAAEVGTLGGKSNLNGDQ